MPTSLCRRRRSRNDSVDTAELLDVLGCVGGGCVDNLGGSELFGHGEFGFVYVNGNDVSPGEGGVLHRKVAEPANTEHGNSSRRLGAAELYRLVGRDPSTGEWCGVEWVDRIGQRNDVSAVRNDVLGEACISQVTGVDLGFA